MHKCTWSASSYILSSSQFYQKWIDSSIHYHIPLCALLCKKLWVWFPWQLIPDPVQASSRALAPFAGHGSLGKVFRGLGKPQRADLCILSSVWNAMKVQGPKWDLWLSIVHFIKRTHYPYDYHIQYHYDKLLKRLKFWVFENYAPRLNKYNRQVLALIHYKKLCIMQLLITIAVYYLKLPYIQL